MTSTMHCTDCDRDYALDGDPPRYYCRDCGGRTKPKENHD